MFDTILDTNIDSIIDIYKKDIFCSITDSNKKRDSIFRIACDLTACVNY